MARGWAKGESGNPGGKKPGTKSKITAARLQLAIKRCTREDAALWIVKKAISREEHQNDPRLLIALLPYFCEKPQQDVRLQIGTLEEELRSMTDEEIHARIIGIESSSTTLCSDN